MRGRSKAGSAKSRRREPGTLKRPDGTESPRLRSQSAASQARSAARLLLTSAKIRAIIGGLARDANLQQPEKFAQVWHMLMKGSIIAAGEGNRNAAREAKYAARLVLNGWMIKASQRRSTQSKKSVNC
jgi:hypothetical protein